MILNSTFTNEKLSSNSSIIFDNAPTNSENNPLINCADFNVNGNTIKNSAEILDNIKPSLSNNNNIPILENHGQSNAELKALKNYILRLKVNCQHLKVM